MFAPLLFAVNVVLTVAVWLFLTPALANLGWLLVWWNGALALEWLAPRLPTLGHFRTATAWSLAVLAQPTSAGACAGLTALFWGARAALGAARQERGWTATLAEWSACLALGPCFQATLGLPAWARWLLAGLAYQGLQVTLARLLADQSGCRRNDYRRLELSLGPLRLAALAAGLAGSQGTAVLVWPALYGLQLGAANAVFRVQAQLVEEALRSWRTTQDNLREALDSRSQSERRVQALQEEKAVLEAVTLGLSQAAHLGEGGHWLANALGQRLQPTSLAVLCTGTGRPQDLDLVFCQSPQRDSLQQHKLSGLGRDLFRSVLVEQVAGLARPPLLSGEEAGLVLPLGAHTLIYVGRANAWSQAEAAWVGWFLAHCRGPWENLVSRQLERARVREAERQSADLFRELQSQQILLDCAGRFSRHVQSDDLWQDSLDWLKGLCRLQGAALFDGQLRRAEGSWSLDQVPGPFYLSQADRARWPLQPGPFENVLCQRLPGEQGYWLLAFAGQDVLQPQQLQILQGVTDLFGTALARTHLYEELRVAYQQLEDSKQLWLQTHKSLAVAQLAAGLAHELNSPLCAIKLSLEAALLQAPEGLKARLTKAAQAVEHSQSIVSRLSVQEEAQPGESTDLVQVARILAQQLEPQFRELGLEFRLESPGSVVLAASRQQAENLLLPLLLNAREALEDVPPPRRITLRIQEGGLEVEDNGPGIPLELHSRLSEPFFTTKRIGRNAGLGLAMVESTCNRLQARWEVESAPGQGSRFRVRWQV